MAEGIVHGGGVAAAVALHGGRPRDWLDLSTGINPCPVALPEIPPDAWHRLPDTLLFDAARQAACAYYDSGTVLPLPVPGTQSVIQILPKLADPGRRIAIVSPTYGEYGHVFRKAGFGVDEIAGLEDVAGEHGLVVVVNPNNPTGRVFAKAELLRLAKALAARDGVLLVDEAFADCRPDISLCPQVAGQPNLVVFRSFGKFFGLAGLRLGFVLAADRMLDAFREALGPWAVSGPALAAAARLMEGDTRPFRAKILERKAGLDRVLRDCGHQIVGGAELFTLISVPRAAQLHAHLCRAHILTRIFPAEPSWMRLGLPPDTASDARLEQALRSARTIVSENRHRAQP